MYSITDASERSGQVESLEDVIKTRSYIPRRRNERLRRAPAYDPSHLFAYQSRALLDSGWNNETPHSQAPALYYGDARNGNNTVDRVISDAVTPCGSQPLHYNNLFAIFQQTT